MANRWLDEDDLDAKNNRWGDDEECEDFDPNKDYYAQKLQKKESNMLQSTERSLRLLEQSEQVGNAAAVELDRQGEVLRRTEKRVDKMEQDLKQSDRHLRSIKSMWGAFMNKFSKEPPPDNTITATEDTESRFKTDPESTKPAPQFESSQNSYKSSLRGGGPTNDLGAGGSNSMSASSTMSAVDDNLDMIGSSLTRLKSLGLGLKDELDAQDPILSRLAGKVERVDDKMNSTNKEMLKIYHS